MIRRMAAATAGARRVGAGRRRTPRTLPLNEPLIPAQALDSPLPQSAAARRPQEAVSLMQRKVLREDYQTALRLLSLIPTNQAVRSQFGGEVKARDGSGGESERQRLNNDSLQEMRILLKRAGQTHDESSSRLRCIHIAGSKGKGTVAALATALLLRGGPYEGVGDLGTIGTYTSPHVVSVRERIMLDGEPVSEELFARRFFELWRRLRQTEPEIHHRYDVRHERGIRATERWPLVEDDEIAAAGRMPFFFRFMTLLAFHVFRGANVRTAVIECGIGGEYDATNFLDSGRVTVAVVTSIEIEHADMLGDTRGSIAWHKAGIFKPGAAAVVVRPHVSHGAYEFMWWLNHSDSPDAHGAPRPPPFRPDDEALLKKRLELGLPISKDPAEASGANAVMAVFWARALRNRVEMMIDVPDNIGECVPSVRAQELLGQAALRRPYAMLNMSLAVSAVREHIRKLRQEKALGHRPRIKAIQPHEAPVDLVNRFALFPRKSTGRWEEIVQPEHMKAMRGVAPRGRGEVVSCEIPDETHLRPFASPVMRKAYYYLDGAHTHESLTAAARWFVACVQEALPSASDASRGVPHPAVAVMFNQQERSHAPELLAEVLSQLRMAGLRCDLVVLTRNEPYANLEAERELTAQRRMEQHVAGGSHRTAVFDNVAMAKAECEKLGAASGESPTSTSRPVHVLVTGSFNLVKGFLVLHEGNDDELHQRRVWRSQV
ncbi:folylpolyglutamate synthase [Magnaporthiopsis poae ATCC 64411]|uniref:tetrahydrofolate synthase n=1 Tax=Magnaporthiopsis poae (strain ATCC 64411 / 73-15) TaxID=644358 RepID=A0A0C4DL06_MAGP6|nr:folylpolyglutamate synthase [Magnaporthiopsis poae ATCC 64411]